MLKVGFVGDVNCGKSSLLNVLLGRSLVPTKHVPCTSVLTHCLLNGGVQEGDHVGEPFVAAAPELIVGHSDVKKYLKEKNEQGRSDRAENADVLDVTVHTGACRRLHAVLDGNLRITDVPGHNEDDLPSVKTSRQLVTSLCHSLIVHICFNDIETESTPALITSLIDEAPHLFLAEKDHAGRAIVFVVTQVDRLDTNTIDSDSEAEVETKINDLSERLRNVLRKQTALRKFPGFADNATILTVGITKEVSAGRFYPYDWQKLFELIESLHTHRTSLMEARKIHSAMHIYLSFEGLIKIPQLSTNYPTLASDVLAKASHRKKKRIILGALGVGTLAVGGVVASAAWAARAAALASAAAEAATATTAAAAAASAASTAESIGLVAGYSSGIGLSFTGSGTMLSGVAGTGVALGTESLAFSALGGVAAQATAAAATAAASVATAAAAKLTGVAVTAAATSAAAAVMAGGAIVVGGRLEATAKGVGCRGATAAVEVVTEPTVDTIKQSEKLEKDPYKDILMWPDSEMKVLYVGEFRGKVPHGFGRLFWQSTQVESFIGEFAEGGLVEGLFINEMGIPIGRLRAGESSDLIIAGFQPESLFNPSEPCAVCLERPSILTEGSVLTPCQHGCVCRVCLQEIDSCPICREAVIGISRV